MNDDVSARRRAVPEAAGGTDGRPRRPGGAQAETLVFGLHDLPGLREFVAARARGAGIGEDALGDLLVAVNEVATNAVTHGGADARLRVWRTSGLFVIEVHDDGHWVPETPPGRTPPGDSATSGMGLWVSSLLSEVIYFDHGPQGTTVTMGFRI
ncbi:ATP-binding protein [Thermopolyspora sp. NPDC052614]|uniref:ATP-binding protein n=1 Tax=Thermopolyspora sp. NPDC052614 TaxID=3155682 RepID=UPI00344AF3F2